MAQFANTSTLSDVIIRYGDEGEKTFYGHRVVLASTSEFFHKAFTGQFMEATAPEITLKEDNAEALEKFLYLCYASDTATTTRPEIPPVDAKVEHEDRLPVLKDEIESTFEVFLVADKYMSSRIKTWADQSLKTTFSHSAEHKADLFPHLIRKLYAPDSETHIPVPQALREALVQHAMDLWRESSKGATLPPGRGGLGHVRSVATRRPAVDKEFAVLRPLVNEFPVFGAQLVDRMLARG